MQWTFYPCYHLCCYRYIYCRTRRYQHLFTVLYTNTYSNQSSLKVNVAQLPYMTQTVRTVVRDCRKVLLAKLFSMCRIFAQVLKCTDLHPTKTRRFFYFYTFKTETESFPTSLLHFCVCTVSIVGRLDICGLNRTTKKWKRTRLKCNRYNPYQLVRPNTISRTICQNKKWLVTIIMTPLPRRDDRQII